jgi:hypothetical protein
VRHLELDQLLGWNGIGKDLIRVGVFQHGVFSMGELIIVDADVFKVNGLVQFGRDGNEFVNMEILRPATVEERLDATS